MVFAGSAATYTTGTSGPYLIVTDLAGTQGSDSISGFEQIEFAEGVFDLRIGTAANDTISDTGGLPDFIAAGAGDDTVSGTAAGDVIFGGEGADSIAAAAGNDTVFGDAGNDQIEGNGGDDLVFGGDGNDTLHGGAGNDTLTGGDGADRFALEQAGGGDHVTDFDMTLTAGRTTDQLDVSDLRDLNGNPINAWDVVVTDDGNGNAVLTFPEGESLVLEGVAPRQMATAQQRHAAGIPCFTTGVRILTPAGEIPVERLRPGDLVVTRDNGPMPVVWAGTRRLGAAELATAPHLRPVRIAPGSWAGPRDLLVSPQHAILVRAPQRGGTESFVRATHLARLKGGKVRIAGGCRSVTYVHLLFEGHQVIFANGVASESYYPGKWGITALDHIARHEVLTLFPDLRWRDPAFVYGPTARPVCRFRDLPSDLADLRLDLLGGSAALLRKLA
ncbi:MAG: Hint domain-containing protein [Paracoccaceae bacterium]